MFEKILVANRGEIAVRIIRACKELNIRSVAVYSEADANAMHTQMADEAVCIGKAPSEESYSRIDRIISAAEITDVDAVHPGNGFLSENPQFADVCENCNIRFIGPTSKAMNALGNKITSRALAKKAGVPIVPGSDGAVNNEQDALATAKRIGYPVIIKAATGRASRTAHNDGALIKSFHTTRAEAEKFFGNSAVYIEKFIDNAHHIEIQIFGDNKGHIVHLGERDCSIQRDGQKLIEESPSPFIENKHKDLRKKLCKAALRIAQATRYTNAGTVEFAVDEKGNFYFLEVSKRIQTEHPVTEEITGLDLVKLQIMVAMGEPLRLSQGDIRFTGHAIQCRIHAEDPFDKFRPCPGRIQTYYPPGGRGVRLDSHVHSGCDIPPAYDSLIAKLIVHGKDRREALDIMSCALADCKITGIKTTLPFQQAILQDPNFRRGVYAASFIEKLLGSGRRELPEENA